MQHGWTQIIMLCERSQITETAVRFHLDKIFKKCKQVCVGRVGGARAGLGVGIIKEKRRITNGHRNFQGWRTHSLSWLWWWLHRCRQVSKLITLCPFNVFRLLCVYYTSIKLEENQNGLSADLKQSPYDQGRTTHFHERCGTDPACIHGAALFSAFWAQWDHVFQPLWQGKYRPGGFWPAGCGYAHLPPPPPEWRRLWAQVGPNSGHSTLSPVPTVARMRNKLELCWATEIFGVLGG